MAGEKLEFEIVSNTSKAVRGLAEFDTKLIKTGSTASREAATIRNALESINNVKIRGKLLGGIEGELAKAKSASATASKSISDNIGGVARGAGLGTSALAGFAGGIAALGVQAAVTALKDGAKAFMDFSDASSNITAKLDLATAKFGNLAQAQKDVRDIAASSRADLEATTSLYSSMALQAQALGISQQQVATATSTVGKALKISGADAAASSSAIRQLGQALGSGKLSGDEFASIAEASPRLMQLFADAVGKPRGELKKLASEGKLTADVLVKGLTDPKLVAGIEKEFGKIPVTFADVRTALSNSMVDIAGAISKGLGAGSSLSGFLGSIRNATTSLLPVFEALGRAISSILGIISSLIKGVMSVWQAIATGGSESISITERLTLAFNLIAEAAGVVAQLVGEYFGMVAEVVKTVAGFVTEAFSAAFGWLVGAAGSSTQTVGQSFIGILRAVKFVALAIPKLFKSAFAAVTGIFSLVGKAINSFFNGNFSAFDGLGTAIGAQLGKVRDDVADVGAQAIAIANDQKKNQATLDRLSGRNKPASKGKTVALDPSLKTKPTAADDKKKDKKSDEEKAKEAAAKKYAEAVAKLKAELQDLNVTEEQRALLQAFENAGLERNINLTGKQADEIRNLVAQIGDAKKLKEVNKAIDEITASTRELAYTDIQLAQAEARRRAGLNADLSYNDALTKKLDAQVIAYERLKKAKADAEIAKDIGKDQKQRKEDADLDRQAIINPAEAEFKRQMLDLERQAAAERERINALEVITLEQRKAGMAGILQSEKDGLILANERILKQEQANVVMGRQAELARGLSDFMVDMWENPAQAMKKFFQDFMKNILLAIAKAIILKQNMSGGFGGIIGGAIMGALGIGGARASGGSVNGRTGYKINEKGQEVFFPGRAGQVLNATKTRQALGGTATINMGNTTINVGSATPQDRAALANQMKKQEAANRALIQDELKKAGYRR